MEKMNVMRKGATARPLSVLLLVLLTVGLVACGGKDKKPSGQALARVNEDEVTQLQLNEELQRAGVQVGAQEAASKQLLESLIDRQLLLQEAEKDKTDRDPKVMQAIERAKALIIAQAYMQKRVGTPAKPGADEVHAYYDKNPQFFANRKQFEMRQLVFASSSLTPELKAAIDAAKTLDEVAQQMDASKIKYASGQLARSSTDLPPELANRLLSMSKGQLFLVREGARSLLMSIADIKDAPLSYEAAAPQIEQFLVNKKNKEIAEAEIKRLRAAAKIEYLGSIKPTAAAAPAAASAKEQTDAAATERGVAGLK